jgi:hypothetical protein
MVKGMEQNPEQTNTPAVTRIDPPGEARITTALNTVGNALMLGATPIIGLNIWDHLRGNVVNEAKKISREKWGVSIAGASVVIGAVLGVAEARRLQEYRNKMSDQLAAQDEQISKTKVELAATRAELKCWTDKEVARKEAAPAEPAMGV